MSYFSVLYILVFLPLVIIIYNILPKKVKPLVLLFSSYLFFFLYSKWLLIFIFLSSLSIYIAGIYIKKIEKEKNEKIKDLDINNKKIIKDKYKKKKKIILIIAIIFNVLFLFYFKYLGFFKNILNNILNLFNLNLKFKIIKHLAPIGISFYTLQAISYLADVYNGKIEAEENLLKLMLYLSFFPTLVEGPITRYNEVKDKIYAGQKVTYHSFCFGYQRILYGLFKKMVIADRLNIFVKIIFNYYSFFRGPIVFLGAIFYTILLYMEFSGTMDIVIGTGEIFNIDIPENFRQPFFSKNISEFWSRWHITLGLWFKDYIFYPVSLSKFVKKISNNFKRIFNNRVSSLIMGGIALFAVWSLNGLWHGAGYQFLFFGYYHFLLIFIGNIFEPYIIKLLKKLRINRENFFYKLFRIIKTCLLIFIGELFFRANSLSSGLNMMKIILTNFSFKGFNKVILSLGLDIKDYIILSFALLFVFIISILKEKQINIRKSLSKKNIVIRWTCFYALILSIIVFGAYGAGYTPVEPIYADF